jgi:hypothetical protein
MGWKWNDIAPQVDELVRAKKAELVVTLSNLALDEDHEAERSTDPTKRSYHIGRASAFREVREAVRP